jgi:Holliday junction resolvase RusA-like endonuclease
MMINGQARVVEGSSYKGRRELAVWQAQVETVAGFWKGDPIDEPVQVVMDFHFHRPASDQYRTRHAVKPDIDKLARSVCDSLTTAKLWKDDSLVWSLALTKTYVPDEVDEGVHIVIVPCGLNESTDRENLKAAARSRRLMGA